MEKLKKKIVDINRVYTIKIDFINIPSIDYIVLWNNIIVEKYLRRFIRYNTEICNLENFFNLNRNSKYIQVEVDWSLTFEYLKEGEKVLTTSFWTTRRRRKKIQRLIEEMPTIEQCKKSAYEIYKNWKCVIRKG